MIKVTFQCVGDSRIWGVQRSYDRPLSVAEFDGIVAELRALVFTETTDGQPNSATPPPPPPAGVPRDNSGHAPANVPPSQASAEPLRLPFDIVAVSETEKGRTVYIRQSEGKFSKFGLRLWDEYWEAFKSATGCDLPTVPPGAYTVPVFLTAIGKKKDGHDRVTAIEPIFVDNGEEHTE